MILDVATQLSPFTTPKPALTGADVVMRVESVAHVFTVETSVAIISLFPMNHVLLFLGTRYILRLGILLILLILGYPTLPTGTQLQLPQVMTLVMI